MTARRTRSPLYPAIALEAALHRAKSLHLAAEDRAVPIPIAAGAWHYRADSSLAAQTVAALRQYGLAEDAGRGPQRTVQVTAAAMQILTCKSDTQRRKFLQEAALRPKIHGELWKLLNQGPISKPDVRDYLVNQRAAGKFNHKRVDRFIDLFRNTLVFAQLCGDFLFAGLKPAAPLMRSLADSGGYLSRADALPAAVAVREFHVPLDSGANAVIRLPEPLSAGDLERIASTLITWKPALVSGDSPIPAIVESPPDEYTPIPPVVETPPDTGRRERRILLGSTKLGD